MVDSLEGLTNVADDSTRLRTREETYDYRQFRNRLAWWLLSYGIDPEKGRGYAGTTVEPRIYIIDKFIKGSETCADSSSIGDWSLLRQQNRCYDRLTIGIPVHNTFHGRLGAIQ